tara:strand:- start:11 stop:421 length:411 start_codon:yes stop_codon:yes gene_type:complete
MKTFKEFIAEGKADAIIAAAKLAKQALTPKNIANSKKVIRNMRFFPKITNQTTADAMRQSKHFLRRGKNTKLPNMPKDTPDKFSNLAAQKKSIHPPTADAAQTKFVDRKIELIKNKNNRRRDKERLLKRMFDKGDK